MIAVDGQLQSRSFQAKDGSNRYVVEIVADNVSFTGERRDVMLTDTITVLRQQSIIWRTVLWL